MQNYLILIALIITSSLSAQSFEHHYINLEPAKHIATYSLKYQPDSTNPSNIRNATLLLFLGDSISMFMSRLFYMSDTLTRKITSPEQMQAYLLDANRPMSSIQYSIYKNYPKGKLTFTQHIPSDTFKYEESLDVFNWNLAGVFDTVCGFKVQKASCSFGGRDWIAWFTTELPFNDGPYKFNGLPGLILKVADTRNQYVFELISINKPEKPLMIDILDKTYVITTKQGYFRAEDSFREDIINRAKDAGMDNTTQQDIAKRLAERNNPIELKRR